MASNPEAHLISSVLRSGDFKTAVAHGLAGDMFHTFRDEWLWMEEYHRKYRRTPTIEAFQLEYGDFRLLRSTDTPYFADEVRKHHARHLLIALMDSVADDIAEGDIEEAVQKASRSIITVAGSMGAHTDTDIFTDFGDIFGDVSGRVARVKERGRAGIPTGFTPLDEATGGWNPGDYCIIGGRQGKGKSWLLQHSAATAAIAGHTVVFNALEQTRAQVAMRIHTLLSASGEQLFRTTALMQGRDFDLKQYRRFLVRLKKTMPGKLHVSDASRGRVSPTTIAAQIERYNPDVVFIDYLTLMKKSGPDWQGIAELSNDVQALATGYQVPIICAAQLNRDAEGRKGVPGTENLSGSDAIGQDAAVVVNLRQLSPSVVEMGLAKNRHGRGGIRWYMQFTPDDGVIEEVTHTKALDLIDRDAERAEAEQENAGRSGRRLRKAADE